MEIHELGFIDKGTGKHQSNVVYGAGGVLQHYVLVWVLNIGL